LFIILATLIRASHPAPIKSCDPPPPAATEKGLANLNEAKLVNYFLSAAPLGTADSPLPDTDIAMKGHNQKLASAFSPSAPMKPTACKDSAVSPIVAAKGNAKGTIMQKAKAKGNAKVSTAMASSASPTKKKRKVGTKKSRNVWANQKKSKNHDTDKDDEDYKDDYSEPSALDNLLGLMDSKDNDVEEDEEEVSEDGGDRCV
jgi:hypothetical protein